MKALLIIAFTIILLRTSFSQMNPDTASNNDYLFNIKVQCQDFTTSTGYKVILKNSNIINDFNPDFSYLNLKSKTVYYINYDYDYYTGQITNSDTTFFKITDCQIDSIFFLIRDVFSVVNKITYPNIVQKKVKFFKPVSTYDGSSASVEFDLGILGQKYYLYISEADSNNSMNKGYRALLDFLFEIINK